VQASWLLLATPEETDRLTRYSSDLADAHAAQDRLQKIKDAFIDKFGAAPEVFARSPGAWSLP
jgi:hypothetical protein